MGGAVSSKTLFGKVFKATGTSYQSFYNKMLNGYNYNGKSAYDYIRSSNSFDDFVANSGIKSRAEAYNAAYAAAPTYKVDSNGNRVTSKSHLWLYGGASNNGDDNSSTEKYTEVKDMSGYADSKGGSTASQFWKDQDALRTAYTQIRQRQGTLVYNADEGATYTGNVNTSGAGSASGGEGGRRQGGDQTVTDARRTDNMGDETLLGGRSGGRLQDKETLF